MAISVENQYKQTIFYAQLTILSGQTESDVVSCGGMQAIAMDFPASWTSSDISFYKSRFPSTDLNFQLKNISNIDGSLLAIPVVANQSLPLVPYLFIGASYLKIVCSVAQGADRKIDLVLQPIFQGVHG